MAVLLSTRVAAWPHTIQSAGVSGTGDHPECKELEHGVAHAVAAGESQAVDALLAAASLRGRSTCAGLVLAQLADIALMSGRFDDSGRFAERSIKALEIEYRADDPILLRPLHLLALARFELGEKAKSRQAIRRMQEIQTSGPLDAAMVHYTAAILLQQEEKFREAEAELLTALGACEKASSTASADYGAMLTTLGEFYARQHRYADAGITFDRAAAIIAAAPDATLTDRITVQTSQAKLYASQGQWREAEMKFRQALEMTDRLPHADPLILRRILTGFAIALRKTHQSREARAIEARASALPHSPGANGVVDITEFRQKGAKR